MTSVSALKNSEHRLAVQRATLQHVDAAARANATALASEETSARGLEGQVQGTLNGVNGQLAAAVAQQEAEQQAAAQRAAAAQAAQAAALSTSTPASSASTSGRSTLASASGVDPVSSTSASSTSASSAPVSNVVVGSGSGSSAVQAAQGALGVPYRWAGASLSGFDCSGLTMWAWSHAGVSLPHSAEAQYQSIAHVSLSALQPGDLIFYADGGYIFHVVMYAGGGQVIQAEDFGTVVRYTPIPGGARRGRPQQPPPREPRSIRAGVHRAAAEAEVEPVLGRALSVGAWIANVPPAWAVPCGSGCPVLRSRRVAVLPLHVHSPSGRRATLPGIHDEGTMTSRPSHRD